MESICDRLKVDMELRNYSPHTRICYLARVGKFIRHFSQSLEEIGKEEIHTPPGNHLHRRQASTTTPAGRDLLTATGKHPVGLP